VVVPLLGLVLGCMGLGDEPAADVANPLTLERSGVRFDYPGNWTLGTMDGMAPENAFTVESPGGCLVMFVLLDGAPLALDELLAVQVAEFEKFVPSATRTPFTAWGRMEGKGTLLDGNLMGLLPGTLRLFVTAPSDTRSIVVMEQCYDENVGAHAGLALVERTFAIAEAGSPR
jgi:hypothetical protein